MEMNGTENTLTKKENQQNHMLIIWKDQWFG